MPNTLRVLAYMDAEWIHGPSKSLLQFAHNARRPKDGLPAVEISLVVPHRGPGPLSTPFSEAAERAGLHIDVVRESGPYDLGVIKQLQAIADRVQPDIVETHNVKPNFLMRLSGLWRRYPWVAFHHGYTKTSPLVRCYNHLDRWSFRAARHVVTVCDAFVPQLVERGVDRDKISVQYHAITPYGPLSADAEKVSQLRALAPSGARIAVSIGRLSREKGHLDLIRAWGRMRRRWPEEKVHLVLVGDGPDRQKIETAVVAEGLAGNVTLVGMKRNVQPYLEVADALVLPSHSEGIAHVLLEAMVARLPIAATRVGGIPEVLTHEKTGLLVEPRDPEALAEAMHRALQLPEEERRKIVEAAEAEALAYTPERYRRSLIALYQRVME